MASMRVGSRLVVVAGALVPALALAHPEGHGAHDAVAGLLHPFIGMDHLLAMVAVGLWASRLGRRAIWTLPVVFPLMMVIGAVLALLGIVLPAIEAVIATSVIVLGAAVALGVRMPVLASAALVGCFAVFHGYAHATEAPSSHITAYAFGFVLATLMLHATGIVIGCAMSRATGVGLHRVSGSLIALAGVGLLISAG